MKRWINIFLVDITLVAALLIFARFLLPVIGMAGIEDDLVQPLAKLTPVLLAISLVAMTLIVFDLKRQSKLATRQARRLVEGPENWSDDFIIGAAIEPPRLKTQVFPEQSAVYQAEAQRGRNGFSDGVSHNGFSDVVSLEQPPEPVFTAEIESE